VRIASRVSELSLHGCYLDMMNPFPMGTMVLVKIAAGDAFFEARSKIIYSQPNMGAGVGFLQIARVRKRCWSAGSMERRRTNRDSPGILLVRNGAYAWQRVNPSSAAIAANNK